ncbi:MAG: hypothetical protein BKP49_10395 [Treponema sp. CETP13]|nr:MAG: hypothetical protein BKP49_10395 [Treponema sp. CETP13]
MKKRQFQITNSIISLFILFLASFVAHPLIADTTTESASPFTFEFSPSFGVLTGTVSEYLYEEDETLQSQLDWQQYAVPYIKAEETISAYNAFLSVSVLSAIPFYCGIMEDYDWLADDYVDGSSNTLSCYSCHDLYLDKRFDLSANAGYTFNFNKFSIAPGFGITYRSQKWTGSDGYKQYDEEDYTWDEDIEKIYLTGTVITYEQNELLPSIFVQAVYKINNKVTTSLKSTLYPYLYVYDVDNHLLTSTQYIDIMSGGIGASLEATISYNKIALNINYEYLSVTDGSVYSTSTGTSDESDATYYTSTSTAGTSSSLLSISISYKF